MASKIKEYYPLATVYPEPISQGLVPPCFMIAFDQVSQSPRLSKRQRQDITFDIHYFPSGSTLECYAVQDRLLVELQVVQLGEGKYARCTNLRGEMVDEVLHIQGNAKLYYAPDENLDPMLDFKQESEVSYG